ncbi:MAG: hypothetical protein KDD73_04570 [Anaerolineales bacterium]|nr:hypothetical protein [Anaerolineales bacterium]MCB9128951.1 hypothetical protein [Ardenticatenales bacterium]MCB9172816.1 hypothetical protein [Ardenticatenales bacterium]
MQRVIRFAERHWRRLVYLLALLAMAASLLLTLSDGDRLRYPDEIAYYHLGQRLVAGEGYVSDDGTPTAYRAPGYAHLVAVATAWGQRPLAAKVVNALCWGLAVALAAWLAATVTPLAAPLTALLALLYPLALYTSSTLYPQTFGTLLLMALLYFMARRTLGWHHAIAAGLLLGLLILTIPAFLTLAPLLLAIFVVRHRAAWGAALRDVTVIAGVALLCVAPWSLRNYALFDQPVPVSTNGGENLLLGNSENTRPNSGVNVDLTTYVAQTEGMDEATKDAALRGFALEWISAHPRQAALLYVQKVANYFNFRNELATASEGSRLRDLIAFVSYYPLLLIALLRLFFVRRFPLSRTETMLYLLYVGNAFISALFFTRLRFRVPFDLLLIALVGIFVGRLLTRSKPLPAARMGGH